MTAGKTVYSYASNPESRTRQYVFSALTQTQRDDFESLISTIGDDWVKIVDHAGESFKCKIINNTFDIITESENPAYYSLTLEIYLDSRSIRYSSSMINTISTSTSDALLVVTGFVEMQNNIQSKTNKPTIGVDLGTWSVGIASATNDPKLQPKLTMANSIATSTAAAGALSNNIFMVNNITTNVPDIQIYPDYLNYDPWNNPFAIVTTNPGPGQYSTIQAAFDDLENSGHRSILIKNGTYEQTVVLTLPDYDIFIMGESVFGVIVVAATDLDLFEIDNTNGRFYQFRDFTVKTPATTTDDGHDKFYIHDTDANVKVKNVQFDLARSQCDDYAFNIDNASGDLIEFIGCQFNNAAQICMCYSGVTVPLVFTGNTTNNCLSGIHSNSEQRLEITNNRFLNQVSNCIYTPGTEGIVIITGNYFTFFEPTDSLNYTRSAISCTGSSDTVSNIIANNTIIYAATAPWHHSNQNFWGIYVRSNATIVGNTVTFEAADVFMNSFTKTFVGIEGTGYNVVANNIVNFINNDPGFNCLFKGLIFSSDENEIHDNAITIVDDADESADFCLELEDTADNNNVHNNIFVCAGGTPIIKGSGTGNKFNDNVENNTNLPTSERQFLRSFL
jgi:hypothetical protein